MKIGDQVEVVANTEFPDTEDPDALIGLEGVISHIYKDKYMAVDFPHFSGLLFAPDEVKVVGILCTDESVQ